MTIVCAGESVRWGERLRAADEADRVARGDSGLGDMRAGGRRIVGRRYIVVVRRILMMLVVMNLGVTKMVAIVMMGSYGPPPPRCVSVVSNHM